MTIKRAVSWKDLKEGDIIQDSKSTLTCFGVLSPGDVRETARWSSAPLCKRCTSNYGAGLQHKAKNRFWLESRTETSPSWNTLKIVLSHFSFSLEHYWLLFVFEIALADKEQRNLYLIPVVSLLSTWQGFCLKTPFTACQIKPAPNTASHSAVFMESCNFSFLLSWWPFDLGGYASWWSFTVEGRRVHRFGWERSRCELIKGFAGGTTNNEQRRTKNRRMWRMGERCRA